MEGKPKPDYRLGGKKRVRERMTCGIGVGKGGFNQASEDSWVLSPRKAYFRVKSPRVIPTTGV